MDLSDAIAKHEQWRVDFRGAMARGEIVDEDAIARDNCCELGRWLYGEGRAKHEKLSEFIDVIKDHKNFHVEAGRVAKLINKKRYTEAESAMNAVSPYASASSAVALALTRLKKKVGG